MNVLRLCAYHVSIPFRAEFGHAAAARSRSDNVLVLLFADDGALGVGESVPRDYVTGETVESVLREVEAVGPSLARALRSERCPVEFLRRELPKALKGNAARCAFELAALDLLSRSRRTPIPDLLGRKTVRRFRPRYGGVIGAGRRRKVAVSALKMRLYGFRDVKLKVGLSFRQDMETVRTARAVLGRAVDLRADANGAWTPDEAERVLAHLARFGISCIEQPLPVERNADLPALRRKISAPIMLDESLCTIADARRAVERGECDRFNIRISKCGGLMASLSIADYARERGVRVQLGCQVGETGVLSAAGRLFSLLVPGLTHLEGSYERHLLSDDVTQERVRFGYGGWAKPLPGPGLGVSIHEAALTRHAERVLEVRP